jgi:hypothetical protein
MSRTLFTLIGLLHLVVLLSLPGEISMEQYAWQPQGRFGKRTGEGLDEIQTALAGLQASDSLRNVLLFNGRRKFADEPTIRGDGAICIKTAHLGYYKCLRVVDDQDT